MTDETVPSDIPTPRMLSWARNSAIYRLERRMMTEKQLFDAISRKAREKFEDISAGQLKAVADFAVTFACDNKLLDDGAYAEISTRSAVRGGKSKRAIAQKLAAKGVASDKVEAALGEANDLYAAPYSPANAPSVRFAVATSTTNARQRNCPPSPAMASASRSAGRSSI
ncbi:UNVERIFIED_ORG: SOS response regulatory protein OraA/RecX [Rhizobium esperanzae]|nr:DNA repair regulator protein RecX [Rhizobium phaseoli Brasil 5]